MSTNTDRVAARLRKLSDTSKKVRERLALIPLRKEDGVPGEVADLYATQWRTLLTVYQDYVAGYDTEFESGKGRALSLTEVTTLHTILQNLMTIALPAMTDREHRETFLRAIEHEVHCFVHSENHITARRYGLDLLLRWYDAQRDTTLPPSHIDQSHATMIVSAFDWDYFRTGFAGVVLPTTVTEMRKARHRSFPTRTRVSIGFDEERERGALEMLRLYFDHALDKDTTLAHWWHVFLQFLGPILYPQEFFEARVTQRQLLEGFCQGLPPTIHAVVVTYLVRAAKLHRAALANNQPLWEAETHIRVVVLLLVVTPTISVGNVADTATTPAALGLLQEWLDAPVPHFDAVVSDVLGIALKDEHFPVYASRLATELDPEKAGCVQEQCELVLRLLLYVIVHGKPRFHDDVVDTALQQMAQLLERLSTLQTPPHARDTLERCSQAMWHAAMLRANPETARFARFVLPSALKIQEGLKRGMPEPYFFRIWSAMLLHEARVLALVGTAFAYPRETNACDVVPPAVAAIRRDVAGLLALNPPPVSPGTESAFDAYNALLHEMMTQLGDDTVPVRHAKCVAICTSLQILVKAADEGHVSWEPASSARLLAPYLLAAAGVGVDGDAHTPVEMLALETIAQLLNVPSPTETRVDSVLGAGLMNLVAGALNDTHKAGSLDMTRRVVASLFPFRDGVRTFYEHPHFGARCYEASIFAACDRLLEAPSDAANEAGQVSALVGKLWQVHVLRFAATPSAAMDAPQILGCIDDLLRSHPGQRTVGVALRVAAAVAGWACEACGSDDAWAVAVDAFIVLACAWSSLDVSVCSAAAHIVGTAVEYAVLHVAALRDEAVRRSRYASLARAVLVPLAASVLLHLSAGTSERAYGRALSHVMGLMGDAAVLIGTLDATIADDSPLTVAQLLGDALSFAKSGQCSHTYFLSCAGPRDDIVISDTEGDVQVPNQHGGKAWYYADIMSGTKDAEEPVKLVWAGADRCFQLLSRVVGAPTPREAVSQNAADEIAAFAINQTGFVAVQPTDVPGRVRLEATAAAGTNAWHFTQQLCEPTDAPAAEPVASASANAVAPPTNPALDELLDDGWPAPEPEPTPSSDDAAELQFAPLSVPPSTAPSPVATASLLLYSLGLMSTDRVNKSRPLSSAIKPQRTANLLHERPAIDAVAAPRTVLVATVSAATNEATDTSTVETGCRALAAAMGAAEDDDVYRFVTPGVEFVTRLTPLNAALLSAPADDVGYPLRFHVVWASSFAAVLDMRHDLKAVRSDAPYVLVALVPSPAGGASRVVHTLRSTGVSVGPLCNGMPVTLPALPALLRGAMRAAHASHQAAFVQRHDAVRDMCARMPENNFFEAFLGPLLSSA